MKVQEQEVTALRCFEMNHRKGPGRAPQSFKIYFFYEEHSIIVIYMWSRSLLWIFRIVSALMVVMVVL